jgi:hypothetical protein
LRPPVEIVIAPRERVFVRYTTHRSMLVRKVPKTAALVAPHLAMNFPFRRWVGIRHHC